MSAALTIGQLQLGYHRRHHYHHYIITIIIPYYPNVTTLRSDVTTLRSDICRRNSVCLSVCRLCVTFVHPTQPVEIFDNMSMQFCSPAIRKTYEDRPRETPPLGVKRKMSNLIFDAGHVIYLVIYLVGHRNHEDDRG